MASFTSSVGRPLFHAVEFKDKDGLTPSNYLRDLLRADEPVMYLAAVHQRIKNDRQLYGDECISRTRVQGLDLQFWRVSASDYHLVYSYCRELNEVCFLEVYEGPPRPPETDGVERAKLFYS
jgi:hypothetical protein